MRIFFSWQGRFSILMGAFLFFAMPNVYAQPCDLVITLDIGQCVAASSTLPVNVTISDPYDEADEITILLDGIEFPWSPSDIRDDEPVIFTCWVSPGNSHTIFTQSLDIPSCTETANFYVPPCVCSLDMTASVSGSCNSSQQVPVTVNVTPTNPVATGFDLFLDGTIVSGSPFTYTASSTTTITIFVNGTGSTHVLLARDEINASCSDQVNVFTPLCLPPICSMAVSAVVSGGCNGNNQVPVAVTVTPTNPGNSGFNLLLDGAIVTGSPFAYAAGSSTTVTILVNGNAAPHSILARDEQTPACQATTNITTPNCIIPCSMAVSAVVSGGCNGNNQVPVAVTVTPTSPGNSGFNLLLDGAIVTGSPFAYAAGSSTTVTILVNGNAAPHSILARDEQTPACQATTNITTPNCVIPCSMAVSAVVSGGCNGNNQVPVAVTVTPTSPGNSGFNLLLDGAIVTGSPFAYAAGSSTTVTILVNGNAAPHSILARDEQTPACQATTNITTPNCVIPCSMAVSAVVSGGCNGNNQVPVAVTVTPTSPGNSGFNLLLDGAIVTGSPFAYAAGSSTTVTILVNGNGAPHSILARDEQTPACQATTNITTPNCVIPCSMAVSAVVSGGCNGNNQVPVAVTVTPTSPGNSGFNLLLDGAIVTGSPFAYAAGSSTTVTILVNGNAAPHSILARDEQTPACQATTNITTPNCVIPCSMAVSAVVSGGCNGNNQVPVAVTVTPTSPGNSGFNLLLDGAIVTGSPFAYAAGSSTTVTILVNGNGATHSILVRDNVQTNCSDNTNIVTPNCIVPCSLQATALITGGCTANNQVPVALTVSSVGQSGAGFNVFIDGALVAGSPFTYSTSSSTVVNILVNGNGTQHIIQIQDAVNLSCSDALTLATPNCVLSCSIVAIATLSGTCNANNELPVSLQLISNGNGNSGFNILLDGALYPGSPFMYNASSSTVVPLLINSLGGYNHTILVTDIATPSCSATTTIFTPSCVVPCVLGLTATVSGFCTANNQVPTQLLVTSSGSGSTGFNIFVDGALYPGGPYSYAASSATAVNILVGGNGGNHLIQVQDVQTPNCSVTSSVVTPNCTIPCSIVATTSIASACNANNQVLVALQLSANGNSNNGFNIFVDGSLYAGSPFAYAASSSTVVNLLINGNGNSHLIQAQDAAIPSCSTTSSVVTPNCVVPCSLSATALVAGPCNVNNKVPVLVTVTASGTGNSGFNIFLDGSIYPGSPFLYAAGSSTSISILVNGNGASHIVQVQDALTPNCSATTTLITPSCIVPCSLQATSTVIGACTANNQVPVQVLISAIGAGNSGFNLFVDGGLYPGSPFSYTAGSSTTINILVNGNGAQHTIQAIDTGTPNCSATSLVVTPNCSIPCVISNLEVKTDPQVHIINLLDYTFSPANLEVLVGDTIRFIWVSTLLHSTTSDALSGPNAWDSGVVGQGSVYNLVLKNPGIFPYYCKTHGGPGGIGMTGVLTVLDPCTGGTANVPVSFNAQAGSTNGYNVYINGAIVAGSPFPYQNPNGSNTFILSTPGTGAATALTIQDAVTSFCALTTVFTAPDCGIPCGVVATATQNAPCTTMGQVGYSLVVTPSNAGTAGFNIFLDGALFAGSPFAYSASSATSVNIFLPGDGANHTLSVVDVTNPECTDQMVITTPNCTSGPCAIQQLRIAIDIRTTHTVLVDDDFFAPAHIEVVAGDTVRFVWVGTHPHTVTSDVLTGSNSFNSGLHTNGYTFDVVLHDVGTYPYYCIPHGSPGGIGMSGSIEVVDPCADGELTAEIYFQAENGSSAGYMMMLDGAITPNAPFPYNVSGANFQIIGIPADGNPHEIMVMDMVNPSCLASATIQLPNCNDPCFGPPIAVEYTSNNFNLSVDLSVSNAASGTTYQWAFGDGTTASGTSVSHIYASGGIYIICVIGTENNGCQDTTCVSVELVEARCEAEFTWTNTGLMVQFKNESEATSPITGYAWEFGDNSGSSLSDPSHTFAAPGIYTVCLTITADMCTSTICQVLDLSDPCLSLTANYNYSIGGANQQTATFTDLTTGNPDQWLWGFGDGQTSFLQNPTHTYAQAGIYNVCLIAGNTNLGCFAPTHCKVIYVNTSSVQGLSSATTILRVVPNPTSNKRGHVEVIGIRPEWYNKQIQIEIADIHGQNIQKSLVMGAESTIIPIRQTLPSGTYFIKIATENGIFIGKLIIIE